MPADPTLLFMCLSAFVCTFLPAILAIVIWKKYKANWRAFLVGAIVFIVAQPLLRIPILSAMGTTTWFTLFTQTNTYLYLILLALSAGLFEEAGRFLGIKFFLKKRLTWENGIMFGLGHGGAEALLLVGINYIAMIIDSLRGQAAAVIANTPPYLFLVGGLERLLAITAHIGMTMLVLYAVKTKKIRYLFYAVLFHTLIDCGVLFRTMFNWSIGATEGYVAFFALLAVLMIAKFKGVMAAENELPVLTENKDD